MSRIEEESNLIVVATAEEYAFRHKMETKDVLTLFYKYDIFKFLRSQYDVLHTQDMGEGTEYVETYLKRVMA